MPIPSRPDDWAGRGAAMRGQRRPGAPRAGGLRDALGALGLLLSWLVGGIGALAALAVGLVAVQWVAEIVVMAAGQAWEGLFRLAGRPDAAESVGIGIFGVVAALFGAGMIMIVVRVTRGERWERYPGLRPLPMRLANIALGAFFLLVGVAALLHAFGVEVGPTEARAGGRVVLALLGVVCVAVAGLQVRGSLSERSPAGVAGWGVCLAIGVGMVAAGFGLWPLGG